MTGTTGGEIRAVHLLLQKGEVTVLGGEPEKVMMEIEVRASTISRVLEDILDEPHRPALKLDE